MLSATNLVAGDVVMGCFNSRVDAEAYAAAVDSILKGSTIRQGLPMPYAEIAQVGNEQFLVTSPRMAMVTPELAVMLYDAFVHGRAYGAGC